MDNSRLDKRGFTLEVINLAFCENPLPPIDEAIESAEAQTFLSDPTSILIPAEMKEIQGCGRGRVEKALKIYHGK